jgi:hypothetical protein
MDQPDLTETTRLQELYARRVTTRSVDNRAGCVAPEAILALVRREGPEADRLATLDHVMACAACHREYEWLSAVDEAGDAAESVTGTASRRPWQQALPYALAASVLLAVVAILVPGRAPGPEPERGTRGDIVLVAPPAGAIVGGPLTFVWRPVPDASAYVLEVLARDGTVAFTATTSDTTVTLTDVRPLLPSTDYQWWVRAKGGATASPLRQLRLPDR